MVGGVVGGVSVMLVMALVVVIFVLRRKMKKMVNDSNTLRLNDYLG